MGKLIHSRSKSKGGLVPSLASAFIPGVGQLINGESDKAIGVFLVCVVTSLGFWGSIPLLGGAAALTFLATWIYGIADAYKGKR